MEGLDDQPSIHLVAAIATQKICLYCVNHGL